MENKTGKDKSISLKIVYAIAGFSFLYSIVRYNVAGGVPWKDMPFFIMNKAISFNGLLLLVLTFSIKPLKNIGVNMPDRWLNARKTLGRAGFVSIFIHAVMSLMLFSPAYYGKFFDAAGRMTSNTSLSMLSGVLAFAVLWLYNMSFYKQVKDDKLNEVLKSGKFLLLVMPLAGLHLFFMGYNGWMNPAGWHAGIPPVSLVAFVVFVAGYVINIIGRK